MAKSRTQARRGQVIEALVLAFSHSGMREIVGTDALRSVVSVEYNDLVESGSFDLQQVWELLEQQPGFSPEAASPPMCLFKSWEEKLGVAVILPDDLEALDAKELALLANKCKVPAAQLARVLGDRQGPGAPRPRGSAATASRGPSQHRTALLVATALVALIGFSLSGFFLVESCAGPQWTTIAATDFAGDLPITDVKRLGSQVGARLVDPGWLSLPEETRRRQLESALRRLADRQITVLFLRDAEGRIRASAQVFDDGRQLQVQFP